MVHLHDLRHGLSSVAIAKIDTVHREQCPDSLPAYVETFDNRGCRQRSIRYTIPGVDHTTPAEVKLLINGLK